MCNSTYQSITVLKKALFLSVSLILMMAGSAQVPFHRGVNPTGWFQVWDARHIQFERFSKKDFQDIKSLGCDVIRLPINLHSMTEGAPEYILDAHFLSCLDSAVYWAEQLNLYLILDNHSFHPIQVTDPGIGKILNKVWPQLAERYRDRSDLIIYELLNEPHGISNKRWGEIQQEAIDAIRKVDDRHTIIVGPSGYNGYKDLDRMSFYQDPNLIYTFHFYDPFMFTHQGAAWNSPSMASLKGIPFPYDPGRMPPVPSEFKGTWVEDGLLRYPAEGNEKMVRSLLDIAINFRNSRQVNVFCGEFGVYIPNSGNDDRIYWYKVVREYLEKNNIPWTSWDYRGTFGLFNKGSMELFETDLNIPLLESLGLAVPEK